MSESEKKIEELTMGKKSKLIEQSRSSNTLPIIPLRENREKVRVGMTNQKRKSDRKKGHKFLGRKSLLGVQRIKTFYANVDCNFIHNQK